MQPKSGVFKVPLMLNERVFYPQIAKYHRISPDIVVSEPHSTIVTKLSPIDTLSDVSYFASMVHLSFPIPEHLISVQSVARLLAYVQYYTPRRRKRGVPFTLQHLRQMAAWVGYPKPTLRSLKQHLPLAAHLVLLEAAKLLDSTGSRLVLTPQAKGWLHHTKPDQLHALLAGLHPVAWQ